MPIFSGYKNNSIALFYKNKTLSHLSLAREVKDGTFLVEVRTRETDRQIDRKTGRMRVLYLVLKIYLVVVINIHDYDNYRLYRFYLGVFQYRSY